MASMVGIIGAEIVTFGLIALPEMLARKYDHKLALGSIAAGGGLATLIPPSVVFIVYGMTAGCSVGDLFIAGIIPGLLLGALFIAYIVWHSWRNPESAPLASEEERNIPFRQKLAMQKKLIAPVLLAGSVGSMYAGIATPTEAAGVGVLGPWCARRSTANKSPDDPGVDDRNRAHQHHAGLAHVRGPDHHRRLHPGRRVRVRQEIHHRPRPGPLGHHCLINAIWVFLGCFLDWVGILFLTVPLSLPIVLGYGFDNVWFGVVFCMNMHISYLSPPFAPSAFYMKSITPPQITMTQIYVATLPYLWLTILARFFGNRLSLDIPVAARFDEVRKRAKALC